MNADGSEQRLVSTGKGRTTCGYFLKDNKHIVYASTHEAAEACPAPPDRSKGYVWAVFPSYDIFLADDDGKIEKKLTDAPGYDAEATVNFKTGKIVYTSMACGDLELWTMKPDGGGKKQLTRREGYDGGAFYSRDGKRMVWRATDPANPKVMERYKDLLKENLTEPMKMEMFIGDAGGGNVKQLTNFGCASFAPTFTPDGKRIIFASNKHNCDGRKFELLHDQPGRHRARAGDQLRRLHLVPRVLAGRQEACVCQRLEGAKSRYEFNIFVADWVD